jgi:hypothetical protein
MNSHLRLILLSALAVLVPATAEGSPVPVLIPGYVARTRAGQDVATLVAEMQRRRDDVDPKVIADLGDAGTREAVEGLLAGYEIMASIYMRREILRALGEYDGVADSEEIALERVTNVATASEEPELRDAALEILGNSHSLGRHFLQVIVGSPAADGVRERAVELHIALGTDEDLEWYRSLYKPAGEAGESKLDKRKKKTRPKRGKKEEEPKEKVVYRLSSIRVAAFARIVGELTIGELKEAVEDRASGVRRGALAELHRRGDKAVETLAEDTLKKISEAASVRAEAARILVDLKGSKVAADLIDLAKKFITPAALRSELAELLSAMENDSVNSKLKKLVGKGKDYQKLFALKAVRRIEDGKLDKTIRRGLKDKTVEVRLATLALVGERGDTEAIEDVEKALDKEKDRRVAVALMDTLGMLLGDDDTWRERLLTFATEDTGDGDEDGERRIAAIMQLGSRGVVDLLERYEEWIVHSDWATRLAALRGLEGSRDKRVLPLIIGRLGAERGRMSAEFQDALWRLTGQPHGRNERAWRAWWQSEGATFSIITRAELERRNQEEDDRRLKQITGGAKFFGIRITSHRVIFIIDVSGSMNELTRGEYVGETGSPRMEVAKAELARAVDGLDAEALFNIIIFSGDVDSWLDAGVSSAEASNKAAAQEYINRLGAMGGTNLYGALRLAFEDPDADTIVVLSDGEPSVGDVIDPHAIREEVIRWNEHRGIEIHCIAVGGSLEVLEWIAQDSGGEYVKFN